MDSETAKQYRNRWQKVAALELQEQRQADFAVRLRQFEAIMSFQPHLILPVPAEEINPGTARWLKLKKAYEQTR